MKSPHVLSAVALASTTPTIFWNPRSFAFSVPLLSFTRSRSGRSRFQGRHQISVFRGEESGSHAVNALSSLWRNRIYVWNRTDLNSPGRVLFSASPCRRLAVPASDHPLELGVHLLLGGDLIERNAYALAHLAIQELNHVRIRHWNPAPSSAKGCLICISSRSEDGTSKRKNGARQ